MPYASVSEVPDYVPKDKRAQWREVWNSAYAAAIKDGKSKDDAESSAFAEANAVAGPNAKKAADGGAKVSPASVNYTPTATNPLEMCERCKFFTAPHECAKVDVQAADVGWCELFKKKEASKTMKTKLEKFIPFAKVDEQLRQVWGVVTAEIPDKDKEVCDYGKSKPYYEEVIAEMAKASRMNPSGGDNFFPLRYMHQLDAIGKCIGFEFRDADKEVFMGFKVVDDAKWKLVQENVLTGFSQGGSIVGDLVPDPVFKGCMRYVAKPAEVSLVDNPCLAGAHFTYVKSDGTVELRKYARTEVEPTVAQQVEDELRKIADSGKTLVEYFAKGTTVTVAVAKAKTKRIAGEDLPSSAFLLVGDPEKTDTWNLPVKFSTDAKTKRHIRNALSRIDQVKGHPPADIESARKRLHSLAEQYGIDVEAEKKKLAAIRAHLQKRCRTVVNKLSRGRTLGHSLTFLDDQLGQLRKGMFQVSNLAALVDRLAYMTYDCCGEQEWEGDEDSVLPEMLAGNVNGLIDSLLAMVAEETDELKEELAARV